MVSECTSSIDRCFFFPSYELLWLFWNLNLIIFSGNGTVFVVVSTDMYK